MTSGPTAPALELVLLGGDIGVYALARAFHEAYGTIAHVITRQISGPVADSRILTARQLGADATEDDLVAAALETGRSLRAAHPDVPVILLANADWLVAAMSAHRDELEKFFELPILSEETLRAVSDKAEFARLCAEIDVPTPTTVIVDFRDEGPTAVPEHGLSYPIVAKAARSSAYAHVSFPGKRKVFEITDEAHLRDLVARLDAAGFRDRFVLQEMIPGDDTAMRSVTAYVDSHGEVTLLGAAHVLLEEHTPGAIGNPAAMITTPLPEVEAAAVRFLEHTGYRGCANFDVKVDPRDGQAKFFEVNPRIGRNNQYMTSAGANVARAIVADVVEHRRIEQIRPDREVLYSIVPWPLLRRYLRDPQLRARVRTIARAHTVHPLLYAPEGMRRRAYVAAAKANHVKKFLQHYRHASDSGF